MSNDFKDMIGLDKKSGDPPPKRPVKKRKTFDKPKPKGMAREVSWLIENEDMPSIVPTATSSALKEKRRLEAVPWKYVEFTNPARKDGLRLRHWVKSGDEKKEYKFASFHRKPFVLRYTDEEYSNNFVDPAWTREATDRLFDMLEAYELRFHVVADRFVPSWSVGSIKHRYYSIVTKLAELRKLRKPVDPNHPNGPSEPHPFIGYMYDLDAEKKRKKIFEMMYKRTREQEKEEEHLLSEAKRIESGLKDKTSYGAEAAVMLAGLTSSGGRPSKRPKRSKPTAPTPPPDRTQPVPLSLPSKPKDSDLLVLPSLKPGAWVRSSKMLLSPSGGQKPETMAQVLADLGMVRQLAATEEVSEEFAKLLVDIHEYLALQKEFNRKDYEVKMLAGHVRHMETGR